MDEITAFCDVSHCRMYQAHSADICPQYLMNSVNKRLLKLLSMVLELPDEYLWNHVQSHDGFVGDGYFRHALYYPLETQHRDARKGVRMYGLVPLL